MVEGHRRTDEPPSLHARASAAMTGGATRSFERTGESRPDLGLQRPAEPRPARCGRTRRNAFQGHTAAFFCARQVEHCRPRRSLAFTFITTRDVFDSLDLDFSWFRYQDQSSGSKTA